MARGLLIDGAYVVVAEQDAHNLKVAPIGGHVDWGLTALVVVILISSVGIDASAALDEELSERGLVIGRGLV